MYLRSVVRPEKHLSSRFRVLLQRLDDCLDGILLIRESVKHVCDPFSRIGVNDVEQIAPAIDAAEDVGHVCLPEPVYSGRLLDSILRSD